ncbi:MAG: FMN-binding negative transcriptional regulator, partial [Sphingobium sp.]
EQIAFHLARANPMTPHLDGARALFVAQGADAYVSPDWYGLPDQVPTWNYVAVELTGTARRLDDDALLPLIDALSTEHEARLSPKPVWTSAKMTPGLAQRMTGAIAGFTLDITGWRGTRKLNQNKNDAARQGVVDALTALGNTAMAGEVAAQ